MATYVIGDIQGCFQALQALVDKVDFDKARDRLWFVGDLVNRGPNSLAVLRFVRDLGDAAIAVLGNHDLHLLAIAAGFEKLKRGDTLAEILSAPDRDALLSWLRHRPLLHFENKTLMVHAGLLPQWSAAEAVELASEVETTLRAPDYLAFLSQMYGNQPDRWTPALAGVERLRTIVNAMTRLRLCSVEGVMEFSHKGSLAEAPRGYRPWFDLPQRKSRDTMIVFGHWSALGLVRRPLLCGLDSGCLWGRQLSALRLEDQQLFQVRCRQPKGRAQR